MLRYKGILLVKELWFIRKLFVVAATLKPIFIFVRIYQIKTEQKIFSKISPHLTWGEYQTPGKNMILWQTRVH